MRSSKRLSLGRNAAYPDIIAILFLLFGMLGFLDAAYLTLQHFRGAEMMCGPLGDCQSVAESRYAAIGGIPIALMGAVYYLAIFFMAVAYFDTRQLRFLGIAAIGTVPGFLASVVLTLLQIFVIRAICMFCMLSAALSCLLFASGMVYLMRYGMRVRPSRTATQ